MEIRYDKAAVKYLQGLPQKLRDSIRDAIKGLTQKPPKGDIRPMQGYKDGRHRLRVGKYRVIYRYSQDGEIEILIVMEIGSRGDIYKEHDTGNSGIGQNAGNAARERTGTCKPAYQASGACLGPGFYKADAGRAEAAGSGRAENRQRGICER